MNRNISTFKYAGTDVNNKPCEVWVDSQKLGGNVAQNWCLLQSLPLLIGDKNPLEDDIWQSCLQLREIVNMVTAPKIHANQKLMQQISDTSCYLQGHQILQIYGCSYGGQ